MVLMLFLSTDARRHVTDGRAGDGNAPEDACLGESVGDFVGQLGGKATSGSVAAGNTVAVVQKCVGAEELEANNVVHGVDMMVQKKAPGLAALVLC